MQTALPSSINTVLFIAAQKYSWEEDFSIRVFDFEPISNDNVATILLTTHDLSIDIPSIDLTQGEINNLEESKRKILSDAHAKAQIIDEKIQSLRCIEHK